MKWNLCSYFCLEIVKLMFLNSLKRKSAEKAIKRILSSERKILDGTIKSVGVIINKATITEFNYLNDLKDTFRIKTNDIEVLTYYPNKALLKSNVNDFKNFSYKDLALGGKFKNETIKNFLSKNFDVLITFNDQDDICMRLAVAKSNSNFKIGFNNSGDQLNDLVIQASLTDKTIIFNEMKKYLKILNKI